MGLVNQANSPHCVAHEVHFHSNYLLTSEAHHNCKGLVQTKRPTRVNCEVDPGILYPPICTHAWILPFCNVRADRADDDRAV